MANRRMMNDVIQVCIHIAAAMQVREQLIPAFVHTISLPPRQGGQKITAGVLNEKSLSQRLSVLTRRIELCSTCTLQFFHWFF